MCDRAHDATIEQRQARAAEGRVRAQPVRAVRIQVQRRGAVALEALAINDRDRHTFAVSCGHPNELARIIVRIEDRKSTRLNSSHVKISYAVFCLKKKK